jgi:hypothetical protein
MISLFVRATKQQDCPTREYQFYVYYYYFFFIIFKKKFIHFFNCSNFRCTLRFPSTNIRIQFENLVDQTRKHDSASKSTSVENTNTVYRPLKISIPEQEAALKNIKSPFPSPTGTMSAANSCPTSPRHNYHDVYSQHNNGSHSFNEVIFYLFVKIK